MEKYISLVTQTPGALFFLTVTMVSALPNAILQSMFPMILMERFHLTAEFNGYMLSGMAVVGMVSVNNLENVFQQNTGVRV